MCVAQQLSNMPTLSQLGGKSVVLYPTAVEFYGR
jgi:hypothetical protein